MADVVTGTGGYTYPSLADISNPGIDRYNEVMDYYATHPQPYTPMMTGLNQFVGGKIAEDLFKNLEYESDPNYAAASSSYNTLTGGNPDYYKSVSDLGTMSQLNSAQIDMANARNDYTRAVLNEGVLEGKPSSEYYNPTYFSDPDPVGMVGDTPIYAYGGAPHEGTYYINKEGTGIEYFEPDVMGPLESAFVIGMGTLMGGIAGGPFGAMGLGAAAGAGTGSLMTDSMNEQPLDWTKAGVTALATYGGGAVAPAVANSVSPYIGNVAGSAVGGAAGGAVSGGISGAKTAIETNSWKPVLYGAGTGALVGLARGGLSGLSSELTNLDQYGEGLAGASSTAYDGGVNYVPVGAGSFADSIENPTTLNQLMTELETPSGGGMSLANDPIPTESINPIGTPEFSTTALPDTDTSSMNITDSFKYAKPAYKTLNTAYNIYNKVNGVYNNYQNYQDAKDIQQTPVTQQVSQPVQTPITAPVGAGYTLGNMPIGEDERRAWGRVLV